MSVDISKIKYPVMDNLKTIIKVPKKHFLMILSKMIPWDKYAAWAIEDLYKDRRRSGRKLNMRVK